MTEGIVCSLKLQKQKGMPFQEKSRLWLLEDKGIFGDRNYGKGERQVCLCEQECRTWMEEQEEKGLCFARFQENIQTRGLDIARLSKGERLKAGDALLEITQTGKECFPDCPRREKQQECRLREGCCFAKVIKDGSVALGDPVSLMEKEQELKRYVRQLGLPGFGEEGQKRLLKSRVLVIGAGGLGCPAITTLAEAGIGALGIADGDVVEYSNLNRQFLYTPDHIGSSKAECAARWVKGFRPDCRVAAWHRAFGREELERVLPNYDFVLSCVDSVETRAIVNETCIAGGIPFVDGAIDGMYGTVQAVLSKKDACLSCVNPKNSAPKHISVSFAPVTMIIGALEAEIALKYLSGAFPVRGGLYSFDGENMTLEEIPIAKNPDCSICGKE